jgi:hypothetical protein
LRQLYQDSKEPLKDLEFDKAVAVLGDLDLEGHPQLSRFLALMSQAIFGVNEHNEIVLIVPGKKCRKT